MENQQPTKQEALTESPKTVWVFDVDGVITDPIEKRIAKPEILDFIVKKLKQKEPVAFLTGRAMSWMEERVLPAIEVGTKDNNLLDNLYVSAEFGGLLITYEQGVKKTFVNSDIIPPKEIVEHASEIAGRYSNSMFIDRAKRTHFTLEMNDGSDFAKFKEDQEKLDEEFRQLIKRYGLESQFEILSDRIASSIRDKRINKRFAVKELLKWLKLKKINPGKFMVFGDSKADLEMGEELAINGLDQEFVFVGEKNQVDSSKYSFTIIITNHKCDAGTLEFLSSLKE